MYTMIKKEKPPNKNITTLQHFTTLHHTSQHCNTSLHHTSQHCSTSLHLITHHNSATLHHISLHCNTSPHVTTPHHTSQHCNTSPHFTHYTYQHFTPSHLHFTTLIWGTAVALVKVLRYKSEGRWFDPRWCHGIFHLHKSF
jgi:hypothetical protein